MIFFELYSSYYNAVAEILSLAVKGELTDKAMYDVINNKAFAESVMTIPQSLKDKEWKLLTDDLKTPVKNVPSMPLTLLQKRWLKSLMTDPRVELFDLDFSSLEDTKPLFDENTFLYFDRYSDGDPYTSAEYKEVFRTILEALREKKKLLINFTSNKGHRLIWECVPLRLMYSSKDDKFRLIVASNTRNHTINLARIRSVTMLENFSPDEVRNIEDRKKEITFELFDKRNALERVMLHFSHLEKETRRASDDLYIVKLKYYQEDETEILIRILSFGPMIKVTSPQSFIDQIKHRLNMQNRLRT